MRDRDLAALFTTIIWFLLTLWKSHHLISSLLYAFIALAIIVIYEKIARYVEEFRKE